MKPPIRVLFIDHETRLSGGERNMVELIESFDRDRVEVHVAVPGSGPLADRLIAAGAAVHLLPFDPELLKVSRWQLGRHPTVLLRHGTGIARAVRDLDRIVRRVQPHLVHTNSQKAHLLVAPVTIMRRVPHIWHVQDILERGWLRRLVLTIAYVSAARVICLSEVTARPWQLGRLGRRVRVVYSGVRQDLADPAAATRWRSELGIEPGQQLVGIVGQIAHWKGQDVLVEAAPSVLQHRPETRFVVVGACLFPENEGDYDRAIRQRSTELGLDGRLHFTGPIEPIEPVMAAIDVLVHASRLPEPFGRVMCEAMVQATPVITTTIGAGPELVPGGAGRHVPPDDSWALAEALKELLDPRVLAAAGARSRVAAARFPPEATRDGVLAVYSELK